MRNGVDGRDRKAFEWTSAPEQARAAHAKRPVRTTRKAHASERLTLVNDTERLRAKLSSENLGTLIKSWGPRAPVTLGLCFCDTYQSFLRKVLSMKFRDFRSKA